MWRRENHISMQEVKPKKHEHSETFAQSAGAVEYTDCTSAEG